jgi:Uma2 family endonuclease
MATVPTPTTSETVADLLEQLGGIAPQRIRLRPPPGQATEQDVLDIRRRERRLYELVDGVLVEKIMGYLESHLAIWLSHLLQSFLDRHDLGILAGPDGALRLMPGLVRIPDITFLSWDQLPKHEVPSDPIPGLAPALAVEVLSEGNTPAEMERKLREYFLAGVRLVWLVDPARRTVTVYTAPDRRAVLTEEQTLDGGAVLPGLAVPLRTLFARTPRRPGSPAKGKGTRPPAKRKPRKD